MKPNPATICYWLILLTVGLASVWAARQIEAVQAGVDDANIFFVYANNLIQGHGFVWNVGGERVEGFSSLSWVVLTSPLFLLREHVGTLIHIFNILIVSFAVWRLAKSLGPANGEPGAGVVWGATTLLFMLWVVLTPRYLVWTVASKMETGLWSAALCLALAEVLEARRRPDHPDGERHAWRLALLMPLVITTRPEGMLWSGVWVGLFFLVLYTGGLPFLASLRRACKPLFAALGSMAAVFAFRLWYFDSMFPNTYYAKVSPDRRYTLEMGYEYYLGFIRTGMHIRLFVILAAVGLTVVAALLVRWAWLQIVRRQETCLSADMRGLGVAGVALLIGLLVPVLVGGDHFEWFRFYQPIWPLLPVPALLLLRGVAGWVLKERVAAPWVHAGAIAVLLVGMLVFNTPRQSWSIANERIVQEFILAEDGRRMGRLLNEVHSDRPEVGAIAVGGIGFAYEGPINDLMGLNNVEMARHPGDRHGIKNHAAFSKEVFFRQLPEIVVPFGFAGDANWDAAEWRARVQFYIDHRWIIQPLKGLTREAAFLDLYDLAVVSRPGTVDPRWILAYYRKDYLAGLLAAGEQTVVRIPLTE